MLLGGRDDARQRVLPARKGDSFTDGIFLEADDASGMLSRLRNVSKRMLSRPHPPDIVRAVRAEALTYLDEAALLELHERVATIERSGAAGMLVEAGCALGGSAMVIASAKSRQRPFYVFDVFGMIPAPSDKDGCDVHSRYLEIKNGQSPGIDGHRYYGYEDNLLSKVTENFRRHGLAAEENSIHFVRGLFQDTLRIEAPVVFAHIDGDWYESVMTCLSRIEPRLVKRGVLVIDDYDAWSGCRKAVDEYFKPKRGEYEFVRKSRLHIIRK